MATSSIIQLDGVSVFQKKNLILSNVTISIDKGEFVYLIGRTGSGKSSFLKILYGELPVTGGTATMAGFDLTTLKTQQIPYLRRKLGIVFQDFQLLTDRSVYENLLFVLKATGWKGKVEMISRIEEVLERVSLNGKIGKMPYELSGGEQQRLAIARALLNDPDVILADEPTGNLDPETSDEIMRLLMEISRADRAVIMATHNYTLLEKFPARIIKCVDTRLMEVSNAASAIPPAEQSFSSWTPDKGDEEINYLRTPIE